ncbi:hypothetical protein BDQ94DRAFT_133306 [Aspergillus welwitschiae]|uniref:Uncharacterized protein n=1 Tax=Aspergillus welwitschiae TaxID=1341132 RepID=A0A3F3QKP9_9EURO|nr:hypothetical protein BDQ94DRAFT_133306 [Aspergillus welwitschiae]RDH39580.1 hypothetical protein BDQ94DRAFT_133306 [Aspergillus welwitschiae]
MLGLKMDVLMYASVSRFSSLRARCDCRRRGAAMGPHGARPRQPSHDRFFMQDNVTLHGGCRYGGPCWYGMYVCMVCLGSRLPYVWYFPYPHPAGKLHINYYQVPLPG